MKWPMISENWIGDRRILTTEYITRITNFILDTEKCTTCGQCVKACPKSALSMPPIVPGVKKTKLERIPNFSNPLDCVFCGTCMVMCPYNAIEMQIDGKTINNNELDLVKGHIIPEITTVKVGKVELKEPEFKSEFFSKLISRIEIKKMIPKS